MPIVRFMLPSNKLKMFHMIDYMWYMEYLTKTVLKKNKSKQFFLRFNEIVKIEDETCSKD